MTYTISCYPKNHAYHETFFEVIRFIKKHNDHYRFLTIHWSRFEWMFARDCMKDETLDQIIIFRNEDNEISGILTFEDDPGTWFAIYDQNPELKALMVDYFDTHFEGDLIIPHDPFITTLLEQKGYEKMDWMDPISWFSIKDFELPKPGGYQIRSLEEDYRLEEIHHALWLGFNHGPEITYTKQELEDRKSMTSSPHFKKKYTFAAHHDTHYVAYAGIWFIEGSKTALIEPVATVPDHRRKGLAQACIYHAFNEVKKDGAEAIFVGSNTKFYQDIGFKLYDASYRYTKKKNG
ncbi:MAG TPA: hypothetical protein DHV05_04840 [Acholeplasmataceae bacterium]|nr:hypothetical protein [Acholeplasmataceae bacterium]